MAEEREDRSREDLTEEASPYRVEEYRRKGIVAQSRELSALVTLMAVGVTAILYAPTTVGQLLEYMREVFRTDLVIRLDLTSSEVIGKTFFRAFQLAAGIAAPVCGAGFFLGILASFIQVGSIFSFDPIQPNFEKINPLSGIKKLISMRQFYESLRMLFKLTVILFVSYLFIRSTILESPRFFGHQANTILITLGQTAQVLFFALLGILAIFAGIDFGLQKMEHQKNLRMTKQEAKQEHKEREGDPQIRARIRSVQREIARRRMMQAVKKADVVVTNPTHIAVALVYNRAEMAAPKVVAKGADLVAQKIKQIATEAGVPLVENVPLARTLFKSVKINQLVPRALYQAVAEVLAYVYRLKRKDL